ncbi:hypothetical protein EAI_03339 [Harpegnathos saltator]|uniref:Uncharacterized protein n=1 Tax=Harpegnathos saltator TaxID=610380 RepID=E2C6E2_HARSA|nr:hypothetical protein EAI_03339 [Harpegnathos saltator]
MEQLKTGGGRPAHEILNPVHETVLTLMNTKTVTGFKNRFDSDATNGLNSLYDASNVLDNMSDDVSFNVANNAMYINNNNESSKDMEEEYTMYETLEEEITRTHNTYVDPNTNTSCKEDIVKRTKCTSNWNTYTPEKLRAAKHTLLKVRKSNTSENKENESNLCQSTARQRKPLIMALNNFHISKQYSDLAQVKLELTKLQLIAIKEEMETKNKQNKIEFELKKESLELDIKLKQAQLRKLQSSIL